MRLLRLADHWGTRHLEAACTRALRFEEASYTTIKRILQQNLEAEILPELQATPPASLFMRSAEELLAPLMGGEPWS